MKLSTHPCSGYLSIVVNTCLLLVPSGFATCIASHLANFISHISHSANINCHNEPVATDTMFSDEPTLGSNATTVQIFIGHNSKYTNVSGVSTDCDLSCTLEENIMNQGAMDVLISDNACAATSQKVKDILHIYHFKSCTSEPHHQHQDYAECCIGHIKDITNHVLTFTGALNHLWLLCIMYVVYILNITVNNSIGDISPQRHLYGQTHDISPALCFQFYEPVYYSDTDSFSSPIEKKWTWFGFTPNVRDILTFHILTDVPITYLSLCSTFCPSYAQKEPSS